MCNINEKNSEEHSDEKGEGQIPGQPLQPTQNIGMDEEIVDGTQHRPEEGKQGADDALHISPQAGVIPQPHLEKFQAKQTCQIFDKGHANGHGQEQDGLVPEGMRNQAVLLQACQQKQHAQAAAVDGQIRPSAEAGVDPFFMALGQVPEQKLQHPAKDASNEKQVGQSQKNAHNGSLLHSILRQNFTNFVSTEDERMVKKF